MMIKGNHEDSFFILEKKEITQMRQEVLDNIRFGNHHLDKQFERDIELLSLALVEPGLSEQAKLKADALLKSMLLLYFGQVYYRHRSDQHFYPLDTLNAYFKNSTALTHFPIASILLHGSRILIEFPSKMDLEIRDWLITDKNSWRYLATHSISPLKEVEKINNSDAINLPCYKELKEEKVNGARAAIHFMSDSFTSFMTTCVAFFTELHTHEKHDLAEHYGFDLALGGVGNLHFASKKTIQNNGEHGHLYINFYRSETGETQEKHSGLLLGIEQSAPGKPDQYGHWHDLNRNNKDYSASGGDFFCKKPHLLDIYQQDYQGLTVLPFASYYDSLWSFISEDTFHLIKTSFEKCKVLLSLLNKEEKLSFIKNILISSSGAKPKDFTQWFDIYFRETPQMKAMATWHENQFTELKMNIQLQYLETKIQDLVFENEQFKKKLTELQQQSMNAQKINNLLHYNLAKSFILSVIQQMGWRANKHNKKIILKSIKEIPLTTENPIRSLLKNFITAHLIQHNTVNYRSIYFLKVCLNCLNLPQYRPLITLLFFKNNKINYMDLWRLTVGQVERNPNDYLEKYERNISFFHYQKNFRKNQLDESYLNLTPRPVAQIF